MNQGHTNRQTSPPSPTSPIDPDWKPWEHSPEDVLNYFDSDLSIGLNSSEAKERLRRYGENDLPEPKSDSFLIRLWGQITGDAVVRLLLFGGIVSFLLGDFLEGGAILLMLLVMALFGLWQEGKADDAARSLRQSDTPRKTAIRDGRKTDILINELVIGDVLALKSGDIVPADCRVLTTVAGEKDSAKLTGESLPVELSIAPLPASTVVNEQKNMLHRGDALVSGNALAIVTATGSNTEIGKIAAKLAQSENVPTPLDEQLDSLGDTMTKVFLWMAVVVIGAGLIRELFQLIVSENGIALSSATPWGLIKTLKESFINAVALIIAAIPEGLPAVLTITLAIASKAMSKRNALVRRPKAVEGGGAMNALLTDKTGTLTANQMEVEFLWFNNSIHEIAKASNETGNDPLLARALRIAHFCNNGQDATEAALLRWVEKAGLQAFGDIEPRAVEHQFDQTLKRMTTVHPSRKGRHHVLTKGAPENVLELCDFVHRNGRDISLDKTEREIILKSIHDLASRGLRVIALADRLSHYGHEMKRHEVERELTLVALLGIMDPPRSDVAPAVTKLAEAGIRTVMVTGDNPVTAYQVGKMVGLVPTELPFEKAVITGTELENIENPSQELLQRMHAVRVFARVTPSHKEAIVRLMQKEGFIVGMTGDGINDALALQRSDVGFAMGNGTDVARESSDVVLMDSRFGTIPNAVEEGRNVLYRIRLYLSYILSGNGCEVGAFAVAYILNIPIPLTALVLLIINFATDSFPALAMAFEKGEPDVMQQPPRKRGVPFITPTMWIHIGIQTVTATLVIMGVYYWVLNSLGFFSETNPAIKQTLLEFARSAAFMTYVSQKLYRAFTARSLTRSVFSIGIFSNRWSPLAVAASLSIALFFVYVPVVNKAMGLAPLDIQTLGLAAFAGLLCPAAEELTKTFINKRPPH